MGFLPCGLLSGLSYTYSFAGNFCIAGKRKSARAALPLACPCAFSVSAIILLRQKGGSLADRAAREPCGAGRGGAARRLFFCVAVKRACARGRSESPAATKAWPLARAERRKAATGEQSGRATFYAYRKNCCKQCFSGKVPKERGRL